MNTEMKIEIFKTIIRPINDQHNRSESRNLRSGAKDIKKTNGKHARRSNKRREAAHEENKRMAYET